MYRVIEIVIAPHNRASDTILPGSDAIADLDFKHDCAPYDTLAGVLRRRPRQFSSLAS